MPAGRPRGPLPTKPVLLSDANPQRMTRAELLEFVAALNRQLVTLMQGTPFTKQRIAANFLTGKALSDLMGPDGVGGPGSLYHALLEQAMGYEHAAYCPSDPDDCENAHLPVPCPQCGAQAVVRGAPSYKAIDTLLKYVVPQAAVTSEQLQQEFMEGVFMAVTQDFDEANQHETPAERKQAFVDALQRRLASGSL